MEGKSKKKDKEKDKDKEKEKVKKIKINDFEKLETVGLGSFGRVRLCKYKKNSKIYVMKILKKIEIIKQKQVDHVFSEYNILSAINHPFIVTLIGLNFENPQYLYLILEYIQGGELFTLLRSKNTFPLEQAKFYIAHIITIFEYLHSKNIIYRDLKPENILINKNGYIKVADFQLAKEIGDRTYTMCGTPGYMAPEMILCKGHGLSVDWWAFGVLLYEMISGIDPFSDDEPLKIYENILAGKIKFSSDFDDSSKSLIKHLLEPELSKRYGNLKNGVDDIKNHMFFRTMNWDTLLRQAIEAPFIPKIKDNDLKYFNVYPDSDDNSEAYNKSNDPFLDWFN